MEIKKYIAKIVDTETEVIGYISECRKYESGSYNGEIDYIISVTEISMPESIIRGCFKVEKESIQEFVQCPVCKYNKTIIDYEYLSCSEKCYKNL